MWNRLKSAMQKNLAVTSNYAEVERCSCRQLRDYIMLNVYSNTGDWPHNNWRAARERVPGGKVEIHSLGRRVVIRQQRPKCYW